MLAQLDSERESAECEKQKKKIIILTEPTAPAIPRRSPIQVLAEPDPA